MRVSIVVAIAENRAIGYQNKLIYWLPNDLKRFKALTTGNTIIMGRRTFESLPKGALPYRRNIVLSRHADKCSFPGAECFASLEEALDDCRKREEAGDAQSRDIFIIGGASVYAEALPLTDRLCLTCIHDVPAQADTFFPEFNPAEWTEVCREDHETDDRHLHSYSFVDFVRRPDLLS